MRAIAFVCALILLAVATVEANHMLAVLLAGYSPDPRWVLLAIVVVPPLYFLPSVLAANKSHPQGAAIFLVNLTLGWTGIGWLACLVWEANAPGALKPYTPLIKPVRTSVAPKPPEVTAEAAAQALEALVAQRYNGQISEAEYLTGRQVIIDQWGHAPMVAG